MYKIKQFISLSSLPLFSAQVLYFKSLLETTRRIKANQTRDLRCEHDMVY